MRPRKQRKAEQVFFEEKKVALAAGGSSGGSGSSSGGGFTPGQNLSCKVVCKEPGGYTVAVVKENLDGFLPTQSELEIDTVVLATFVCMHNGRLLLSARFSTATGSILES